MKRYDTGLYNIIINEHFLALDLITPLNTVEKLKSILKNIIDFKENFKDMFEKSDKLKKEYDEYKLEKNKLNSELREAENLKFNLFKNKIINKVKEKIVEIDCEFNKKNLDYREFMENFDKVVSDFFKKIVNTFQNILNKSLFIINFKGENYNYLDRCRNIDEIYYFINNECIPYFEFLNLVLYRHINDVMNKSLIKKYTFDFMNSGVNEIIFEFNQMITNKRNILKHNEVLKLNDYKKDENLEKYIQEKIWETTLKIIKLKKSEFIAS